jgi:hypothetical protein
MSAGPSLLRTGSLHPKDLNDTIFYGEDESAYRFGVLLILFVQLPERVKD